MRILEYVLPVAALSLAVFNAVWLCRINRDQRRRRAALLEAAHLRADRELERALGPGNEGVVTRGRLEVEYPSNVHPDTEVRYGQW